MISVLCSKDKYSFTCDIEKIVYVTRDINNIFKIFQENKFPDYDSDFIINNFEKDKEISTYFVDMKKKIITGKNDKIILNFDKDYDKKEDEIKVLINKKRELIKECLKLTHEKKFPKIENNYFSLITSIERSTNIQEDVDYLEVIKEELEKV